MSLRLRLTLTLGTAFLLIWLAAAAWMLHQLRWQLLQALDERLAASARMVAGLMVQLPEPPEAKGGNRSLSAAQLGVANALACQVSSLRGEILARSHSTPAPPLNSDQRGFGNQMIDGENWRTFTLQQGELRVTTADRVAERQGLQTALLLAAAVPVAAALLGSLILLWLILRNGLAPLQRMRQALQRRSAASLEPLAFDHLPGELQPLVEAQNQLLQRIEAALKRERQLTNDAAHELRSPLTAIKTHLQVARMTTGDDREQALRLAETGADRMQSTLEQLLMLARVEGNLDFTATEHGSSMQEVARQAIGDTGLADRIQLHCEGKLPAQILEVSPALGVAALRNLLDNALRHTRPGTEVTLSLSLRDGRACFQVQDQGPGVEPRHLQRLGQRFWHHGGHAGSGLGLAIVQAIATRCGGQLTFQNTPQGLQATLCLPVH